MTIPLDDPKHPDMSPAAIDRRLRMVESLRKLCVSLKEAGERTRQKSLASRMLEPQVASQPVTAAAETPAM